MTRLAPAVRNASRRARSEPSPWLPMPDVDVLVVGAGPAGAVAAWHAKLAAPELDVVLLERDRAVGAPVRCAEGVGDAGLREFANPDGADWVSRQITDVIFQAPDDTEVVLAGSGLGWILDRTRFDAHLAAEAAAAGAEVLVGAEATAMSRNGEERWHVRVKERGREDVYRARVVIGADGVETMIGRWAGLDTRVPSRDMESCAQYVLQGIDFNPDAIYLQFSNAIAPGGYAWIFPKAVGVAHVGLGIVALKTDGRNARQYLDDWVARRFPNAARTGYTVGGVIVHTTIKKTYGDGVLVPGDAAHMLNPLSGGGITNAMKAGRLAGRTAADAICAGDTGERRLAAYHKAWMDLLGEDHLKYYRIKQALEHMYDAFYNSLARTVNGIAPDKRTIGRVFTHALIRHPQVIPVAARLFV